MTGHRDIRSCYWPIVLSESHPQWTALCLAAMPSLITTKQYRLTCELRQLLPQQIRLSLQPCLYAHVLSGLRRSIHNVNALPRVWAL